MVMEIYRTTEQADINYHPFTDTQTLERGYNPGRKSLLAYRSPEGIKPTEISVQGVRLLVPRFNIFGIQPINEYSRRDEKATKEAFKQYGDKLLYENPVLLCALESNSLMTLALIDGHHRTRFAGSFGINRIPSIVFTPEQATILWNDSPDTTQKFTDPEEFQEWMNSGILEAIASFEGMHDTRIPKMIPYANSVEDLQKRFEAF